MKKIIICLLVLFIGAITVFAQETTSKRNVLEPGVETYNQIKSQNSEGVTLLYDIDLPYNGIIEIEYDSIREGLWLAREDDGIIYLVDLPDGNIMMEVDAASIGLVPDGKFEGIEVLPNGNILLSDLGGDNTNNPPIIGNYLLEINPDEGTLVNYWPTTGSWNTSTDGSDIGFTLGVSIGDNGNIYLSSGNGDFVIYEIATTPGLPGTWETVDLHPIPDSINVVGIDHIGNYWGLTDWWHNDVYILDDNFETVFNFKSTHYAVNFNFGITFIESEEDPFGNTEPLNIVVHTAFGRIGFYTKDPCSSITCVENQEVMADETNFYTVTGAEFDAGIVDTCGMGITNIINSFNNATTLSGAQLPIGTTTIAWSFSDGFGNQQDCSFDVSVDLYNGISYLSKSGISIYPNPANNIINLISEDDIINLEISDITGKTIFSSDKRNKKQIDISKFENGIYILLIQTDKGVFTSKIVKNLQK